MNFNNLNWQPPISYSEPNPEALKALEQERSRTAIKVLEQEQSEDCISRKALLEQMRREYGSGWKFVDIIENAPSILPSEDCISRKQIIEAHYEWCNKHQGENDVFYTWSLELMKNAPSVVPSRATGKWVVADDDESIMFTVYKCSRCGNVLGGSPHNYCPNCGARMESDTE